MRIESDKQAKNGGWIHRLTDATPIHRRKPRPPEPKRLSDAEQDTILRPFVADWARGNDERIGQLARQLGVTVDSLIMLGTGWDGEAWTNPEMNHRGLIVGIKRRLPRMKLYHVGSRPGLTYYGVVREIGPVFIVEGASDTAAGLTMWLNVIGRPSNVGGIEYLARLLGKTKNQIILIAERDRKQHDELKPCVRERHDPQCKRCRLCWPGKSGAIESAAKLSNRLGRTVLWRFCPDGAKEPKRVAQRKRSGPKQPAGHDTDGGGVHSSGITRKEWSMRFNFCFLCGTWMFLETHEIARGCNRSKGLITPGCWIRVCRDCHRIVEGWQVAKQLALKKWHDPEHYDRVAVNLARGRQPEAITEEEVEKHLP